MARSILFVSLLLIAVAGLLIAPAVPSAPAWEMDRRASQDITGAGQNETFIAANPLNPDNAIVVYKDYRSGMRNYVSYTSDGGITWQEQLFPRPSPNLPNDTDPTVFFRPDGRAYLIWTSSSDFQHGGLFSAWSDDGGQTWSAPSVVTLPAGHFDDKAWLAFDTTGGPRNGTIYAAWTRFGNAEIMATSSTDGGASWGAPVQVSSGLLAQDDDGAQPLVLPDGTLVIIFLHSVSASIQTVALARSTDGGATFSPGAPLFDIVPAPYTLPGEQWRIVTYHSLAYDPIRGWLTLVWSDYRDAETSGLDIYTSRSTDAGATWSAGARLNDDPPGLVRDQWFPAVVAAPDGRLTAEWLDRRDDPANRLFYAYARTSTDGGLSWLPSARISSMPSDPNVNIPPGSDGIGDYIGLAAGPGVVWGSWVDVRNGNQDIYAARELFTPQPTPTSTFMPTSTATGTATAVATAVATATATATATVCMISFTDVPPGSTFYSYIRCLACKGIISGYGDGAFRPQNALTRGQAAKIIANAAGYSESIPPTQRTYIDVEPGSTFWLFVERIALHGAINGYPCGGAGEPCPGRYFRPANSMTRGQLAKVDAEVKGYSDLIPPTRQTFSDVAPGSTFWLYIERVALHGVVSGYSDGTFRPANDVTRGQAAKIVSNTFFPGCNP